MLVLSRKVGETICIGDDIKLFVVQIRGDKVRVGVEAPDAVAVHRQEVYDAILKSKGIANEPPRTQTYAPGEDRP